MLENISYVCTIICAISSVVTLFLAKSISSNVKNIQKNVYIDKRVTHIGDDKKISQKASGILNKQKANIK